MTHTYHDALPGYSPAQVLHDGCDECEQRAASFDHGIATLDRQNFARAWERAATWNRHGLPDLARAEMPMFRCLWSVQIRLQSAAGLEPGSLPQP